MVNLVLRSVNEPIRRSDISMEERWRGADKGLIGCWERGREKSQEDPGLAESALRGELLVLNWKGGVAGKIKTKKKYGTLNYLAQWQGLRGEHLHIDLDKEYVMVCTRYGVSITYTGDYSKYANA